MNKDHMNGDAPLPRVLVISHNAFSDTFNNGKTFQSMFARWPGESLAQLFFSSNEFPAWGFCRRYFQITDFDILRSITRFGAPCGRELTNGHDAGSTATVTPDTTWRSRIKSKADLLEFFRDIMWKSRVWKTKELEAWITGFDPQLVFYVGGNLGFSHEVARWVSTRYGIPLCVFFTDDYVLNPVISNPLDYIQAWRKKRFYAKTIRQASQGYVIGEMMAAAYSQAYGRTFIPIMNSVTPESYVAPQRKPAGPIVFSYFGGLHLHRWKMLLRLAELLRRAAASVCVEYSLDVYTMTAVSPDILEQFSKGGVNFCGMVSGQALKERMSDSDVLVHVESMDRKYRTMTRYSISTKIPEYLLSGRCVLAFGPDEVASIQLLRGCGGAVVITDKDGQDALEAQLRDLLNSRETIEKKGYDGYCFALNKFNGEAMRDRFARSLSEVFYGIGDKE